MSKWAKDPIARGVPWEIYTSIRYDPILRLADDELQKRPNGENSPFFKCEHHRQRLIRAAEFFRWTSCSSHQCLQDLDSWDNCLYKYVNEYQKANVDQDVTEDTPLFVRIAMINPDILSEYSDQSDSGTNANQEYKDFLKMLESNPSALGAGLHFSIRPVPVAPLEQLFPKSFSPSAGQRHQLRNRMTVVLDSVSTDTSPFTYIKTYPRTPYDSARKRMNSSLADMASTARSGQQINGSALPNDSEILLINDAGEITEGSITSVYFFRKGQWVTPLVGPDHGGLPGVGRRWALEHKLCVEQAVKKEDVVEGEDIWLSNGVRGFIPGIIVGTTGS